MIEWRCLADVCEIKGRIGFRGYTREDQVEEGDGAISLSPGNIIDSVLYYDSCTYITWDKYEESPEIMVTEGDIVLCKTASVGKVARVKQLPEKATINPQLVLIKNIKINPQYLFYVLDDTSFQSKIKGLAGVGSVPNVSQAKLALIPIPIPSISEQQRIVGILDTFTASIENLKEQIAQRRKQYEHYRDELLDLEGKEGVEIKTLGEIGEFVRGNGIQKNDFVGEGYKCIHYGQIHARYGFSATETISKIDESLYKKCKKAKKGDVVLATTSEDAEGVAKPFVWLGDDDAAVSGDAFIYHHNQNGKFMGHQFLTHKFMQFKVKYATGAKVVRISGENMAKYEVALPSIEEQSRIVSILDTFEASISNLEAQLKLREKQYEYYRNKLLTFEKAE